MAKIYTSREDENAIQDVIKHGLQADIHKWGPLRLALAISLRLSTEPSEEFDKVGGGGSEYSYEQLCGKGQDDYADVFCALLSVYHDQDLFADPSMFRILLQRHVRRGLREIRASWAKNHDFAEFLYQELFATLVNAAPAQSQNASDELLEALDEIGVRADVLDHIPGPRITRYFTYLKNSNDLDKLQRGLDKISFKMGLGQQRIFEAVTDKPSVVGLDVPRPREQWTFVGGAELRQWAADPQEQQKALPIRPAVDVLGRPICLDLAEAPHLLVGGTTGSGKSVCLHALILSLLHARQCDAFQLCLIDPKTVEFHPYASVPDLYGGEVVTDDATAFAVFHDLVALMAEREKEFSRLGAVNIFEANEKQHNKIPRIVVVVEELADLLMQNSDIEGPLVRLAQRGRSAGVHLVLATQRPDSATFSGLLRSNVPSRIALTVQKSSESKIILDEVGAERLVGKGDMLIKFLGNELIRAHGVHIKRDDISLCLKQLRQR